MELLEALKLFILSGCPLFKTNVTGTKTMCSDGTRQEVFSKLFTVRQAAYCYGSYNIY